MLPDSSSRLARAGLLTFVVDGLWACVLSIGFYKSTFTRLWQGVASTLLGPRAFDGGTTTTLIGLVMHLTVAFAWSAVFLMIFDRSPPIRRVVATRYGALKVAAVYGPLIWMVMSLIVIPLLVHRPPSLTYRWFIQMLGHIPFVGLPIVWSIGRGYVERKGRLTTLTLLYIAALLQQGDVGIPANFRRVASLWEPRAQALAHDLAGRNVQPLA
jgi:hypothetical protein